MRQSIAMRLRWLCVARGLPASAWRTMSCREWLEVVR